MAIHQLFSTSLITFLVTITILGLLIGSFLNVVIHRLPLILQRAWLQDCREWLNPDGLTEAADGPPLGLVKPRSRCPECGHGITALENIPLISYLVLRGRCAGCRTPISKQYPLIEALTGLLTLMVAWHFGYSWQTGGALILTWALIALAVIDAQTTLLPDNITLPLLWLGLIVNFQGLFTDLDSALIGAIAGYLSLWLVYQTFRLITGKEGMGYGDFKLLAVLGAWLGWQNLPVVILLSSLVGAAIGIGMIAVLGRDRNIPIPFGPYLAIAGWIALLWGAPLTQAYFGFMRI